MFNPLKLKPIKPHPVHFIPDFAKPLVRAVEENGDIAPIVLSIARSFGFDGFLYGASLSLLPVHQSLQFIFHTWPGSLFPIYDERRYVEVDPRIRDLIESVMPLAWDRATYEGQSAEVDEFLQWLDSYGICSGVTCPLRDIRGRLGALFLSCDITYMDEARRSMIERNLPDIVMFGHCFHELFVGGALDPMTPPPLSRGSLTVRELECLELAKAGKTGEMIAVELGISKRTVQTYFDKVKRKLGALNRQDAVSRGLQIGII